MAFGSTTAAVISVGLAAAGTATSVASARDQRKAGQLQQRRADSQAALERRNIVRQERIRRAQILNESAQRGTQGSSSEVSATSGLAQGTTFDLTQSTATANLSSQISDRLQRAANFGTAGNIFSTGSSTASIFARPS